MNNILYGHAPVLDIFDTLFQKETVPHGILLSGKKSSGKRKLARELAKKLLSGQLFEETAKIKQETLIDQGQHPDLLLIQREENSKHIKVEQIRSLIEQLSLTPYYGSGIVAIINDAHTMNISAANTLLKTLEEPEPNKYIFLISDSPQLLPDTILSRCHHFSSPPLSHSEVISILKQLFGDLVDEATLHKLSLHANDSLALINITSLIDERSLGLSDSEKAKEVILELSEKLGNLSSKIDFIFEAAPDSIELTSRVIQLINSLEKEPELPLFWDMFMDKTREKAIKSDNPGEKRYWANRLIELSEIKSETGKRNLVPSIQSSAIFS